MSIFVTTTSAVFGLLIGSFLTVVIHRVPEGVSIVTGRSRCPACQAQVAARDNIPVVSWLLLRGRCRNCSIAIPIRYPLVELATAALFVLAGVRFGLSWVLPAYFVFFSALLAISIIDLERFIIPKKIVYFGLLSGGALLLGASVAEGALDRLLPAAVGGVSAFGTLFIIHFVSPRGMGFGDVRLAGLIGLFLGWLSLAHVALGLFLSFLLASVVGIGLMVAKLRTRKDPVPFGPFLAGGAVIAVLVGEPLLRLYLG